jgi:hypothetical protein
VRATHADGRIGRTVSRQGDAKKRCEIGSWRRYSGGLAITPWTAPDDAQKKKDYDDFQALAAKEPLTVKLADAVGHIRVANNFAWTLNTGYLVLFMQAGFALLTFGLVRKKAGRLMMLSFAAYEFAFVAYYGVGYAFQCGAVAVNAAPSNLSGTPTLNHFLLGSGLRAHLFLVLRAVRTVLFGSIESG